MSRTRIEENKDQYILINIRTVPEVRAKLNELSILLGKELGLSTRLSQSQTLEVLIANAWKDRGGTNINIPSHSLAETTA